MSNYLKKSFLVNENPEKYVEISKPRVLGLITSLPLKYKLYKGSPLSEIEKTSSISLLGEISV